MKYIEMTVEEAMKRCKKYDKVLVAVHDLEDDDCVEDVILMQRIKREYNALFNDVKAVASLCDDFVKQLRLFTEKQNIHNISPHGIQKTIMLQNVPIKRDESKD